MSELHVGEVLGYDDHVGIGTVGSTAGQSWMFHITAIADQTRSIDVGQRVAFLVGPGGPGQWEASQVTKL